MISLALTLSTTAGAGTGVRGERIIDRTVAAWQSQQVQEPCILENPQDPSRLVMFYSGVPAADCGLCFVDPLAALQRRDSGTGDRRRDIELALKPRGADAVAIGAGTR